MAVMQILRFPDPRLRVVAQKVMKIDAEVQGIVADMYETMYASRGIGLAATQVGIHQQIFVMDLSETHDQRICAINPEILQREGEQYDAEGCLSVEGAFDKVKRAQQVRFRALNLEGNTFEMDAIGLMAACVQHEIDHLQGILFIDHLSRLKQSRIRKKIQKSQLRESS